MHTPYDPADLPTDGQPTADELLIGELTAALSADAASAEDALPPAIAALAVETGEAWLRDQASTQASTQGLNQVRHPSREPVAEIGAAGRLAEGVRPVSTPVTVAASSPLRAIAKWGGWFAAAAVLALWTLDARSTNADSPTSAVVADPGAALRDSLLGADPSLIRVAFAGTADPSAVGAGGEVLWSGAAQRGVMRIVGLAPNDRARLQYQLWIFDKARDQRYPVDGGVFDIPAGATEVLVPISARVPVREAALFAVTVEPAGGVVVSTRERVALLAEL